MGSVEIQFLGTGDALGSGGRFQTCFLVCCESAQFLIDCGASSLIAMKQFGVRRERIDMILLTHLHGDHFGGIPFFILDAQFSGRTQPLVLAGPAGVKSRVEEAMEALFPGSSPVRRKFEIAYVEWKEREAVSLGFIQVTPWPVIHPSGGLPFALRIEAQGKVIGYSGDTEWTDALVHVAQETDLFICESYTYEKRIKFHLNYQALSEHRNQLGCRRLFLTHMSEEMLSKVQGIESEITEDGRQVSLQAMARI